MIQFQTKGQVRAHCALLGYGDFEVNNIPPGCIRFTLFFSQNVFLQMVKFRLKGVNACPESYCRKGKFEIFGDPQFAEFLSHPGIEMSHLEETLS